MGAARRHWKGPCPRRSRRGWGCCPVAVVGVAGNAAVAVQLLLLPYMPLPLLVLLLVLPPLLLLLLLLLLPPLALPMLLLPVPVLLLLLLPPSSLALLSLLLYCCHQ